MAAAQSLAKNLVHPRAGLKSGGQMGGLGGRATATAMGRTGSGEDWLEGKEATGDAKAVLMNERRDMIEKMMEQKEAKGKERIRWEAESHGQKMKVVVDKE
ncbi:MAG: hypothetical protein Q9173_005813 [Seirophora scorigena]